MSELLTKAADLLQRLSIAIATGEIDQLIAEAEDWTKDYSATPRRVMKVQTSRHPHNQQNYIWIATLPGHHVITCAGSVWSTPEGALENARRVAKELDMELEVDNA